MPTKSISNIQSGVAITGTTGLQISPGSCVIFDIEGEVNSTTGTTYYIQLLGQNPATATSGTTIPLYSRECIAASAASQVNGFSFVYRPIGIDTATMLNPAGGANQAAQTVGENTLPVWVTISSTDKVWTSVAANTFVTVDIEETWFEPFNQTITGDLTTGRDSLTVFSDPNPANRLTAFNVTNGTGATAYLMLFAYANPANGTLPLAQWQIANGVTLIETFGRGRLMMQQDSSYVNHTGCYLVGSSTTQFLTATSATNWKMQAYNI